jgi:hypothetical protein
LHFVVTPKTTPAATPKAAAADRAFRTLLSNPRDPSVLVLPAGAKVATRMMSEGIWTVFVAAPPSLPDLGQFWLPDSVSALLAHNEGEHWPNPAREAQAAAALRSGGLAIFGFQCIADAIRFTARLEGTRDA